MPTVSFPFGGSSGFTAPLGAGKYSFRVQDFGGGIPGYGLDIQLTAAPVPAQRPIGGISTGLRICPGLHFVATTVGRSNLAFEPSPSMLVPSP